LNFGFSSFTGFMAAGLPGDEYIFFKSDSLQQPELTHPLHAGNRIIRIIFDRIYRINRSYCQKVKHGKGRYKIK